MTLTPEQAAKLRAQILHLLHNGEPTVDLDERFIRPIFGAELPPTKSHVPAFRAWCEAWDLKFETYVLTHGKHKLPPVWMSISLK